MNEYVFTFRSLTQAQQAAVILRRGGLDAMVLRTPRSLSDLGCGYGVRTSVRAAGALRKNGISYGKSFRIESDGSAKEVWL